MNRTEELQYLEMIHRVANQGPYYPEWKSLSGFSCPEWFPKARFGIFIHWGLYSLAAHSSEWYPRNMYIKGSEEWEYHRKTYGPHTEFGYKEFIPLFRAEKYDPKEWAEIIKNSGAQYVFPVAEHHDGFQMYGSEISKYNSCDMGPKRDLLGELKVEVEKQGIHFCTSSHRAEHWFFLGHGKEFESDIREPLKRGDFYWPAMPEPDHHELQSEPYPSDEFVEDWLLRTCELIDRYRPELLYFDWWIQHEAFRESLKILAAYYYNRGAEWGIKTGICYKHDSMMFGSGIVEMERGSFQDIKPFCWQSDTAIARNSWGYTDTLDYKNTAQILCEFVEAICRNGNMLLNIGPKGDGSIAEKDKQILSEIGAWMDRNREAVFGTKPWRKAGEGAAKVKEGQFTDQEAASYTGTDIRFTVGADCIYAFVMKYPKEGRVTIRSLAVSADESTSDFHGLISDVSILGFSEIPQYTRDFEGLHIETENVSSELPVVIKVRMK